MCAARSCSISASAPPPASSATPNSVPASEKNRRLASGQQISAIKAGRAAFIAQPPIQGGPHRAKSAPAAPRAEASAHRPQGAG